MEQQGQEDIYREEVSQCQVAKSPQKKKKTLTAITGRNVEHTVMMHELSGSKRF